MRRTFRVSLQPLFRGSERNKERLCARLKVHTKAWEEGAKSCSRRWSCILHLQPEEAPVDECIPWRMCSPRKERFHQRETNAVFSNEPRFATAGAIQVLEDLLYWNTQDFSRRILVSGCRGACRASLACEIAAALAANRNRETDEGRLAALKNSYEIEGGSRYNRALLFALDITLVVFCFWNRFDGIFRPGVDFSSRDYRNNYCRDKVNKNSNLFESLYRLISLGCFISSSFAWN